MWIGESPGRKPDKLPLFYQRLKEMGINTTMVSGEADPAPALENHFPYYVENMVNRGLCLKFNSNVRDWDKFVTEWNKNGRPKSAMTRDYCLVDPEWRDWASKEVTRIASQNAQHHPLAYNLRDELSTTYSANPFDYDFSPASLAAFRKWLHGRYSTLAALNAEWETAFSNWDEVTPFTTDEIKARMSGQKPGVKADWPELRAMKFDKELARQNPLRWNFAPWADFRSFMDRSLMDTLQTLTIAAHHIDPETPVGIEGTQMPSAFGGYDFRHLADEMDWVEAYDIGSSREILESFMAFKPVLTTVFENDTNHARRRLWHLLLEGDRGCIVWWSEDCIDFTRDDYALTPKAKALAPVLKEMASPLAKIFIRPALRTRSSIYILYSQPSIQLDWMLESAPDGVTWQRRFSSYEAANNHMIQMRDGWLKALQDLGYDPVFLATDELDTGMMPGSGVLILTDAAALDDVTAAKVNAFAAQNTVLYDAEPGTFDGHCKLRITNAIHVDTSGKCPFDPADYAKNRLGNKMSGTSNLAAWLSGKLKAPPVPLDASDHVRLHQYYTGAANILAFERNAEYSMSESLSQAGGNEALEKPISQNVILAEKGHLYDLNTGAYLGFTNQLRFTLDPWHPSLFAAARRKIEDGKLIETLGFRE